MASKTQMKELEECLNAVQQGINETKQGRMDAAEQILKELQNRYQEVAKERSDKKSA